MSEQRVAVGSGLHRPLVDRRVMHFLRHLGEMTVAMMLGMVAFTGPIEAALRAISWGALGEAGVSALSMALSMSLPMAGWMRYRGHAWKPILEMSAAMIVPTVALLGAWRADAISADTLMVAQHTIMLPTMIVAMLHRRRDHLG